MLESCLWILDSAFNTIIPSLLQDKLIQLGVPDSTCRWITDFLSDRKQHVRLGKHLSESQTISTGSPQGCVLSPLLFSLYSNSCTSSHQSVKLLKFADDSTIIGLISGGDESAYRWEIDHMAAWCTQNNLVLNAVKTVEMVVDFRKNQAPLTPITISLRKAALPHLASGCWPPPWSWPRPAARPGSEVGRGGRPASSAVHPAAPAVAGWSCACAHWWTGARTCGLSGGGGAGRSGGGNNVRLSNRCARQYRCAR